MIHDNDDQLNLNFLYLKSKEKGSKDAKGLTEGYIVNHRWDPSKANH